ncbi:MAG: hypothetical protein ACLPWS_12255 [Rhodomicrobium sp.]
MRKKIIVGLIGLLPLWAASANADDYAGYDLHGLLSFSDSPSGKQATINMQYLDKILNDLSAHAGSYPPHFDSPGGKERALHDAKSVAGMLATLTENPPPNPEVLLRAGIANNIGTNLDIPGCAEKTNAIFQKLLAISPDNARANYIYGTFLGSTGNPTAALPYLEKARAAGIPAAYWAIGTSYLALGDQQKALGAFREYQKQNPSDANTAKIIDAITNGRVQTRRENGPPSGH